MRLARQPFVAVLMVGTAFVALTIAYRWHATSASAMSVGLAMSLIAGTLLAYHFPMYVRHNTKLCVISIPLYLMVVLLPVPLAATVVGLAVLVGELLVSRARGTHMSDIGTTTARWILIALAASAIAHLHIGGSNPVLTEAPLLLTALALWLGDLLTLPIVLVPITGEKPTRIMRTVAREGAMVEALQYLLGVLGVLAATWQLWALFMLAIPAILVYLAFKKEMDDDTFELLESMADSVDLRDPYTGGHSRRVAELAAGILGELGMRGQEARLIRTAARIHDLGKISLPDTVLIKAGALSPEEEALIQSYPGQGAEMLARYPDFSRGIEMVRHHHERWDGMGYPDMLTGTEIPFGARVIAVVDAFDAMTSDRPYRRALSMERAAEILRDGRGRQWDPQLVDAFLRSIGHRLETPVLEPARQEVPTSAAMGKSLTA